MKLSEESGHATVHVLFVWVSETKSRACFMNLFHRLVAEAMQGTDKSLGFGWGEGDNSRHMPTGLGELPPLPELQSRHDLCSGARGTTGANTSVQAPQAEAARRLPRISQSGALQQVWMYRVPTSAGWTKAHALK